MTQVTFDFDEATAVVLPGAASEEHPATWAVTAAERILVHHDATEEQREILVRVLARAQTGAVTDPGTNLLLREPATATWVPLRFMLLERALDADEQRHYLWPPAVLPPQVALLDAAGLGLGCSSTVLHEQGSGSVRWLFMPSGVTFFAALGAAPAPALAPCAVIAENIIGSLRLDGVRPDPSPGFDAQQLAIRSDPGDSAWRV